MRWGSYPDPQPLCSKVGLQTRAWVMKLLVCMCRCLGSLHAFIKPYANAHQTQNHATGRVPHLSDVYRSSPAVILALSGEKKWTPNQLPKWKRVCLSSFCVSFQPVMTHSKCQVPAPTCTSGLCCPKGNNLEPLLLFTSGEQLME